MKLNKRAVGDTKELLACNYLKDEGAVILERNFRCRTGEIDIIAKDAKYLCFIEVKYRSGNSFGEPEEAVNFKKRKHICKVSDFYLYSKYKSFDLPVRYDVVAISQKDNIFTFKWIKNAFDHI
ncbi:MAG: YraN family protein [Butyrivibrio sp.]|nr:YraN family protein [Butyrivibrio sp.]